MLDTYTQANKLFFQKLTALRLTLATREKDTAIKLFRPFRRRPRARRKDNYSGGARERMLWPENNWTTSEVKREGTSEEKWFTSNFDASKVSAAPVDAQKTQCLCAEWWSGDDWSLWCVLCLIHSVPAVVQTSSKGSVLLLFTPAQAGANDCSNTAASRHWAIQRKEVLWGFIGREYSTRKTC